MSTSPRCAFDPRAPALILAGVADQRDVHVGPILHLLQVRGRDVLVLGCP
jgi:hypothetical protein